MSLLEVLSEQSAFGFTGKINVLIKSSSQLYGTIYQNEGSIVGAIAQQFSGKKALFKMVFLDVESSNYLKYVVEPEIIKNENIKMNLSYIDLKAESQTYFQTYIDSKKLKPPMDLQLIVNPEIVVNQENLTPEEFDTLSLLTEWSKVSDVYSQTKLLEFELTNSLVSLRRKKAIRVFQN